MIAGLALAILPAAAATGNTVYDPATPPLLVNAPDNPQRWLASHNAERARLRIPPLVWSDALSRDARQWARDLARRNAFEHFRGGNQGENLWTGTAGRFTPEEMIGFFINERGMFRPGKFPKVTTTRDWIDVGHYTQLIWRTTRQVGCALERGQRDDFLVCRYFPAGNVIGTRVP